MGTALCERRINQWKHKLYGRVSSHRSIGEAFYFDPQLRPSKRDLGRFVLRIGKVRRSLDADLQDESEVLLEMYHLLLREKANVVYGVRISRSETKGKQFLYFFLTAFFLAGR